MSRNSRHFIWFVSICCLLMMIVAGFILLQNVKQDNQLQEEEQVIESLREEVVITPTPTPTPTVETSVTEPVEEIDPYLLVRIDFDELQSQNADCQRWIMIPDTNVDYPVMEESEFKQDGDYFYLHHDFNRKWKSSGSIFTLPSTFNGNEDAHLLVFGHHMVDKTVAFSNFRNYFLDEEDATAHRYIYMYYPNHSEKWVVWTVVEGVSSDKVYTIPYTLGTQDYQDMLDECANKGEFQLVDAPTSETKTLILSTCNGRQAGQKYRLYVIAVPMARYYYDIETLVKENYYEAD